MGASRSARLAGARRDRARPDRASGTVPGLARPTNRAGGLEGGVTNGEDVRVTAYMKPISTLMKPLRSVDLTTMTEAPAAIERSDVCAVPAAAVVGEAMVALVLADALLEKFGGDIDRGDSTRRWQRVPRRTSRRRTEAAPEPADAPSDRPLRRPGPRTRGRPT